MDALVAVHPWVGYAVTVVVLVVAAVAFSRARDSREFSTGPFSLAAVLIDIQVLLGIAVYGGTQAWESGPLMAYVHPVLALLALVVAHVGLRRARGEQMVAAAHRTVGKALVASLVLLLAAVGTATAA